MHRRRRILLSDWFIALGAGATSSAAPPGTPAFLAPPTCKMYTYYLHFGSGMQAFVNIQLKQKELI